jgi:hypothetical protein
MNLQEQLLSLAKKDKLGHFYILETSSPEDKASTILLDFIHGFIQKYYQQIEGQQHPLTHLLNHPDVFILGNLPDTEDPVTQFFKVDEAETLNRFFEFKAVQSKRKFAVITEGHRVNNIVSNKWLKLLEEPQGQSTIFLLNPRRQKLLDTIHSRALHLRLPYAEAPHIQQEWLNFLQEVEGLGLAEFLENYNRKDQSVSFWTNELIQWESSLTDGAISKNALAQWLNKLHEMETFNQPSATKWTLFYSYLHEHVFPRLSR